MANEAKKSLDTQMIYLLAILVASNAYFVQRVIASVDMATAEISALKVHVAKIESKIDDMRNVQQSRWKRL